MEAVALAPLTLLATNRSDCPPITPQIYPPRVVAWTFARCAPRLAQPCSQYLALQARRLTVFSRLRSLFASSQLPKEQDIPLATRQAETIHAALLSAVSNGALSESEIAAAVLAESAAIHGMLVSFEQLGEIENAFKRFIAEGTGFRTYIEQHAKVATKYSRVSFDTDALLSIELGWGFALGPDFIKSIERIGDKKLQGRVLDAILKIARSPTTVVGDTVKPLTADLKGLWRYRVGSYRLVYAPDSTERRVTLLSFEARGDVYS